MNPASRWIHHRPIMDPTYRGSTMDTVPPCIRHGCGTTLDTPWVKHHHGSIMNTVPHRIHAPWNPHHDGATMDPTHGKFATDPPPPWIQHGCSTILEPPWIQYRCGSAMDPLCIQLTVDPPRIEYHHRSALDPVQPKTHYVSSTAVGPSCMLSCYGSSSTLNQHLNPH